MKQAKYNDDYIRKNLSKDYEESLQAHKMNYLKERESRIKRKQAEILREQERIKYEDQLEKERKNYSKQLQYCKPKKINYKKKYEEKLKTVEVILPMNSDERLKKFHNHIYKLSDKAKRNKKLFMEYNEKSKNNVYYN